MKKLIILLSLCLLVIFNWTFAQNVFPTNGNVGIGTTNPGTNLHIKRNGWTGLRLESSASGKDPVLFLKALGGEWSAYNDDSEQNKFSLRFNNSEKFSIDQYGQIDSKSSGWNHFDIHATGVGKDAVIRLYNDQEMWSMHNDDSEQNKFSLRFNNSEKFSIDQYGQIDSRSSGWNHFDIFATGSGKDAVIRLYNDQEMWSLHNDNSEQNKFSLRFNNSEKFSIDQYGQVGIGNLNIADNSYKLAVDGKVICEELKVQLSENWPDYVFHSDYNLPSLEKLENHIKEKGHLPGIPSAKEIEQKGGMEVGEMQRLLLEKVEELTLYILDLKKENQELNDRLEQLENK